MTVPIVYVSDGPWGTGQHQVLTPPQFDGNWYALVQAVTALQALPMGVGIANITQPTNTTIKITMTDGSSYTFTLPAVVLTYRGEWQPNTTYNVDDIVTVQAYLSVYLVLVQHTSAATFDPGANDGAGHSFYGVLLTVPTVLPPGGTTDQVLGKVDGSDFNGSWRSSGMPRGGVAGNVLSKNSSSDFDASFVSLNGAGITLAGLPDTNITSPAAGQVMQYAAGKWTNKVLASLGLTLAADLGDVVITSPTAAQVLQFVGGVWTNITLASLGLVFANVGGVATPRQVQQPAQALSAATGTVSLDPTATETFTVTPTGAITLNAASAPSGGEVTLVVTTSGTTSFTITFGANFKSTGTLATGTVTGKVYTVSFVGDGTNLNEMCRTTAM